MPRETVVVPVDEDEPALAPATILAVVAYPDLRNPRELNSRDWFWKGLRAFALRRRGMQDKDWAGSPQLVTPGLLFINPKRIWNPIKLGMDRIVTKRLPAGVMAKTLIANEGFKSFDPKRVADAFNESIGTRLKAVFMEMYVETLEPDPWTEGTKKKKAPPSVNVLTTQFDQRQWKNWEDAKKRIWSPTKPVAHMAVVLDLILDERYGDEPINIVDLLKGDWVNKAIVNAEGVRQLLIKYSGPGYKGSYLRFRDEETVRFVLKSTENP